MSEKIAKENIRANRSRIQANLKSLVSKCLEKQHQPIFYKIQKYSEAPQKAQSTCISDQDQGAIVINGTTFQKTKSLFENQYIKLRKIGEGCQSVVYQCQEKATGIKYAAKMLANVDEEKVQFIKDKFQILSSFNHHQIIKSKAVFINQTEKTCYVILQYCHYPTLRQFMVENKGKIQEQIIWKIIRAILSGIRILNYNNIFHRDLKPQNLLYNSYTGQIKIIDFETAKKFETDNTLLSQTGTLLYRAPQTFVGFYGKKIDIWSIGVICYQLMFSCLPFFSQNQANAIKQIRQKPLEIDRHYCSHEMQNMLKQLLEKQQNDRISAQDAISLIDEELSSGLALKNKHWSISTTNSMMADEIESPPVIRRMDRQRKASQPIIFLNKENRFGEEDMKFFIN